MTTKITSGTASKDRNIANINPFRYRGYYYDTDIGMYYLQSRFYNPEWGRFLNGDSRLTIGSDLFGTNLFANCGNNPINRVDPIGEAWWHWALGAAVVAACAVATIVTCGGVVAAATAVGMVASGGVAFTTSSTVAAAAFLGSSAVYGMSVLSAATSSNSMEEFYEQGSWWTVAGSAGGAILGGIYGYVMGENQNKLVNT